MEFWTLRFVGLIRFLGKVITSVLEAAPSALEVGITGVVRYH